MKEETKEERTKIIVLSGFALVVLFLFAFGCYGCSYQPITPPDPDMAIDVTERLAGTTWGIDEAEGAQESLDEFGSMVLHTITFSETKKEPEGELSLLLWFDENPEVAGRLSYQEGTGFYLTIENTPCPVSVVYSQSKDGLSETLTLKGQESNIQCYYLKK
ncbi:MAG: hypothetical protein AB7D92_10585 [Sphaerochaeta sp.]